MRQRTVRPAASSSLGSKTFEAGRLRRCMVGEGKDRHIAHWRSVKFTDHWEEQEEDGTKILHDRERFSHELTLVFANGKTQILTHEKKEAE